LVWDYPGRPVPEETPTHSHPSWSSDILYQSINQPITSDSRRRNRTQCKMTLTYQGCVAVINGWKDRSLQAVNVLTMSYQLDFIRQTVFRLHSAQGQYQHWTSLILLLTKQDATYVLCTGQKLYRCRPLANNVDYVDSWQVWTCPSMSLPQNCTFHWGDPSPPETWFLGPTRVHTLNGTSSTSVGLPVVSTDTQRNKRKPRYINNSSIPTECTGQKLYHCHPLANNVDYVDSW